MSNPALTFSDCVAISRVIELAHKAARNAEDSAAIEQVEKYIDRCESDSSDEHEQA